MGSRQPELDIRPASFSDLHGIAEAERICFDIPWSERYFREMMNRPAGFIAIGRVGGMLAVYLAADEVAGKGHLLNLATMPKFRRRGLARAMLSWWLRRGRRAGWTVSYLEVRAYNRPAILLYESFGYVRAGIRNSYYDNGEDALVMVLAPIPDKV